MPEVKRGNPKVFQDLALHLKELEGLEAKVGWFPTAVYPDGTPVAYAAALNETGHGPTPPRSYFRTSSMENKEKWTKTAGAIAGSILEGKNSATAGMDIFAQQVENDVLKKIVSITSPPLSPITIELRAMKMRNPDLKITGAVVGQAAARVRTPGYQPPAGVSTKPLNDSGLMIATLSHEVVKA